MNRRITVDLSELTPEEVDAVWPLLLTASAEVNNVDIQQTAGA